MPPESIIHVEAAGSLLPFDGPVGLSLHSGAKLADALNVLGFDSQEAASFGIWGRRAKLDTPLQDGDRIECYRALKIDPKAARRVRATRPAKR